jgi:hypothetical protein
MNRTMTAVTMSRWVGKFPSLKLGRMVGYQSLIERDFIYLLDFDATVTTYAEQPFSLHYKDGSKQRRYTPDFSFTRHGQTYLVECKHHEFMQPEENRLKWAAAQQWCDERGAIFVVVTEAAIRAGHRLENVKLLTDYARYAVDESTKLAILQAAITANSLLTMSDLMMTVSPSHPQTAITPILHMVYHRLLFVPLDEAAITVNSTITFGQAARWQTVLPATIFV